MDKRCRIGRFYEHFLQFVADQPDTAVVEMDTVEGKKGGRAVKRVVEDGHCSVGCIYLRRSA
ncbi:MAG: hypothetical protein DDT35_00313 [Firmicutes bacterium]|nr:hypothetical protein [Bacillota bacterium]